MRVHDIADLTDDGDEFELPDGRSLRLKIKADECMRLSDDDWYGEISDWYRHSYGEGRTDRPSHFDGRARKLRTQSYWCWWQPPKDLTDEQLAKFAATMQDIAQYGYQLYVLELLEGEDAYGQPIAIEFQALGGIEPFADAEYVRDFVSEMINDLGIEIPPKEEAA